MDGWTAVGTGLVLAWTLVVTGCGWVDAGVGGGPDDPLAAVADIEYPAVEAGRLEVSAGEGLLADVDEPDARVELIKGPAHAAVFKLDPDGGFVYEHDGSETTTDSFGYAVHIGETTRSSVAKLLIAPTNDPPIVEDVHLQTVSGVVAVGRIPTTDPDDEALTFQAAESPTDGVVVVDAGGEFSYTPFAGFVGTDRFSVAVVDPHGAEAVSRVTVEVALPPDGGGGDGGGPNQPPVADDMALSVDEDRTVSAKLNARDPDGDPLEYSVSVPDHGVASVGANGRVEYGPNPDYFGEDRFTVTVADPHGASIEVEVRVQVVPVNDPPVTENTRLEVRAGEEVSSKFVASDVDGDSLSYEVTESPTLGTLALTGGGGFTYRASASASGADRIGFSVSDGVVRAVGEVEIVVTNTNLPPTANDDDGGVLTEDQTESAAGDVLLNDSDPEGSPLKVVAVEGWAGNRVDGVYGRLAWKANGHYRYQLDAGAVDSLAEGEHRLEHFRYSVVDEAGAGAAARLSFTVIGRDDPFAVRDDRYDLVWDRHHDVIVSADEGVLANDGDPDTVYAQLFTKKKQDKSPWLELAPDGGFVIRSSVVDDWKLPAVEYEVYGDGNLLGTGKISIDLHVACLDEDDEDGRVRGDVAAVTDTALPLVPELLEPPKNGTLVWEDPTAGLFAYIPDPTAPHGRDVFAFRVTDALGKSITGSVKVVSPYRIMPLGDSLTEGLEGADWPTIQQRVGYRAPLAEFLAAAGYPFDFVGGRQAGMAVTSEPNHEGHAGYPAYQTALEVGAWLDANPADIVLLYTGSDQWSDGSAVGDLLASVDSWSAKHHPVSVLTALIIDRNPPDPDGQVTAFNLTLSETEGAAPLVDMQTAFRERVTLGENLYTDDVHPNTEGYRVMAGEWFDTLRPLMDKCD